MHLEKLSLAKNLRFGAAKMTNETLEKRIYLICPVRNISEDEGEFIFRYVKKLESEGCKVHYPPRDVNQNDKTGVNIVKAHKDAMKWSTEVHAYLNPKSEGSVFDLGMAWALDKPLTLINKMQIEHWLSEHPGKSFARVLYELDKFYHS